MKYENINGFVTCLNLHDWTYPFCTSWNSITGSPFVESPRNRGEIACRIHRACKALGPSNGDSVLGGSVLSWLEASIPWGFAQRRRVWKRIETVDVDWVILCWQQKKPERFFGAIELIYYWKLQQKSTKNRRNSGFEGFASKSGRQGRLLKPWSWIPIRLGFESWQVVELPPGASPVAYGSLCFFFVFLVDFWKWAGKSNTVMHLSVDKTRWAFIIFQ